MGRGAAEQAVVAVEQSLPLDRLFAQTGFDPIAEPQEAWQALFAAEPQEAWQALFAAEPQLFAPLKQPLSLPTEWPVIAFLYAIAHDEVEQVSFSAEQRQEINRGVGFLRSLTGLSVPSVSIYRWKPGSVAFGDYYERVNPRSRGFSLAAEPQLRTGILLKPTLLEADDPQEVAGVVTHEAHHAAHATTASPRSAAYRQPLIAQSEELAVLFCEVVVRRALRGYGAERAEFEEFVAEREGTESAEWLRIALDLVPKAEPVEIGRRLSELAVRLLALDGDEQAATLLNESSGLRLSAEQWRQRYALASFVAR